jgi:uncharacterized membrane protein
MSDNSVETRRPRPRIESLTDLIFGLALSIGALALLNNQPSDAVGLASKVGYFAFSFLILISIWLRYTDVMSVLPVETRKTRGLNIVLLFFVALEPYLFNLFSLSFPLDVSTTAYALDIGSIYAILASFNHILATDERHLVEPNMIQTHRLIRNMQIIVSAIFLVSIIPIFYDLKLNPSVPVRYLFWSASFFFIRGTSIWKRTVKGKTKISPEQ